MARGGLVQDLVLTPAPLWGPTEGLFQGAYEPPRDGACPYSQVNLLNYRGYPKLRTYTALGPYSPYSIRRTHNSMTHTVNCVLSLLI